jgi:hypothetical protein
MANFSITSKDIQFTNDTTHTINQNSIELRTRQLQVKVVANATLENNESYYLGYIQVCTNNNQKNFYSNDGDIEQRWEFNTSPISDSDAEGNIPWYGVGNDPSLDGSRRVELIGPINADQNLFMSDRFEPRVAKFEILVNGTAGQRMLNRIQRNQSFRLWLVAVDVNKADEPASYQKLMQLDWTYNLDGTVSFDGNGDLNLTTDNPVWVDKSDNMDQIPVAAFNTPIANDNQELACYLDDVKQHVIVARKN